MQIRKNCHESVWILSGTADGPILAKQILKLNYRVFASVISYRAGVSYLKDPKLHIITGRLNDKGEIVDFIERNKIKFVIDATHPFAKIISKNLNKACQEINKPLLVFQRKSLKYLSDNIKYVSGLKDIKKIDLKNKNILLAIGSRLLDDTANYYLGRGANVFARVLPTNESISKAFGSCIKNTNIAILEPSKNKESILEKKLCDYWQIDYVLCRESGSYSQKNWERIISGSNIKLYLVKRPNLEYENAYFFSRYNDITNHIKKGDV